MALLRFAFVQATASRTALGPTQPPIQWVPGVLSLGVKRWGRETDHPPPSSAEVKECVELYFLSPNTLSWRAAYLSTGITLPLNHKCSKTRVRKTKCRLGTLRNKELEGESGRQEIRSEFWYAKLLEAREGGVRRKLLRFVLEK